MYVLGVKRGFAGGSETVRVCPIVTPSEKSGRLFRREEGFRVWELARCVARLDVLASYLCVTEKRSPDL